MTPQAKTPVHPLGVSDVLVKKPAPTDGLAQWTPQKVNPWDRAKASHLLRRAGFGGRPEEIEAMVTLGMDQCVDLLLNVPPRTLPTTGSVTLPTGEQLTLSTKPDMQALWLYTMATTLWPLQEKMSLFWHDHFASGFTKVRAIDLMAGQINTFRNIGVTGTFRDLLIAVSKDPAMLLFLDNSVNTKVKPQENYGREIMELFSMGVHGGYTEADVKASARCFTGWGLAPSPRVYQYQDVNHDYTQKILLGRVIQNPQPNGERDGFDAIDTILAHPSTSRYLVKKILEYFVQPDPDPVLVDTLAARWVQDGYRIRSLLGTIFRSQVFYSDQSMHRLMKNPSEYTVGAIRNTGTTQLKFKPVADSVTRMGQDLFDFLDPSGHADGPAWISSMAIMVRSNAMMELARKTGSAFAAVLDPLREVVRKGLTTAKEIVDHYLAIMVDDYVPSAVRDNLYRYMRSTNGGAPYTFDVLDPISRDYKIRGLIHLITLLPQYHVN